jgi:hypothetical protein
MDAISGLISNLGGLGKVATGAAAGAGTIGTIMNSIQQANQLNRIKANENLSPTALGQRVSQATQPLSTGLQQNVGNIVQADLASRGLAQAPGIFQGELATQLAPFYQQNQNTAAALIAQQLGLPTTTFGQLSQQKQPDMSALFTKLFLGNQSPQQTPGLTPPTFSGPAFFQGGQPSITGADDTSGGPTFG